MTRSPPLKLAKANLLAGSASQVTAATTLLRTAAAAGESEAHELLAMLAAAGIGQPRSSLAALGHLNRAAEGGSSAARAQLEALADAAGPDPFSSWAAMPNKRVLNEAPRIVAIDRFLSPNACRWIIKRSEGRLAPSMVYASAGPVHSQTRSNRAFEMSLIDCDVVIILVRLRIAATIGVPVGALETSQVLHYATGQQFAPHYDYLDPTRTEVRTAGQRVATFLIYLNDVVQGGETDFPLLNIEHRGASGSAIYFGNVDPTGEPDPRTLHAGRPPTSGEKWVFSQWVRNRAYV